MRNGLKTLFNSNDEIITIILAEIITAYIFFKYPHMWIQAIMLNITQMSIKSFNRLNHLID
jgi:hypothetical protein